MALVVEVYIAECRSEINTEEYSPITAPVGYNKSYRLVG